jgi:hypothetical protein
VKKVAAIVNLSEQRRHMAAKRGFQSWEHRFGGVHDAQTRLGDLSDASLKELIRGGAEGSMPLYDCIMGILGLGLGPRFYYMENKERLFVMDIALFLLDQLRFQAMRRLAWVDDSPLFHIPIVDLILDFSSKYVSMQHWTPTMASSHPMYVDYMETFETDRGSFVRRLIPQALEEFGNTKEDPSNQ